MRRLLLAACVASMVTAAPAHAAKPKAVKVVQANVGNINGACAEARFKLCQPAVEARAAKALRKLKPDVAGFEELLPPGAAQTRRLLGPGYAVACTSRYGWDCVAVRRAAGLKLKGKLRTLPVVRDCDDGFTLNTGTLLRGKQRIALGLLHPDSSSTDAACRADQLRAFFDRFPTTGRALVLSDLNVDLFRESDASVDVLRSGIEAAKLKLASGRADTLLPGTSMQDPTGKLLDQGEPTIGPPFGMRTLDYVLRRGLTGSCEVRRVDGGGGMDHRAQVCSIR